MGYRNGVVLQIGPIAVTVDINTAVQAEEGLKVVCVGTDPASPHVPTGVKQSYKCASCGNADYGSFKKARVSGKADFTVVEQSEVAETKATVVGATKDIISLSAHPIEEVREQTIQGKGTYYLAPAKPGLVPLYGLVVDTLYRHPELAFLGLWTPSSRPTLFEVRLFGETIVMEARERTESIKIVQQAPFVVPELNQGQIDMLLPSVVKAFDPATYADTYQSALDDLIASKVAVEGVLPEKSKSAAAATPVGTLDLTALLTASLGSAGLVATPPKKRPRKVS